MNGCCTSSIQHVRDWCHGRYWSTALRTWFWWAGSRRWIRAADCWIRRSCSAIWARPSAAETRGIWPPIRIGGGSTIRSPSAPNACGGATWSTSGSPSRRASRRRLLPHPPHFRTHSPFQTAESGLVIRNHFNYRNALHKGRNACKLEPSLNWMPH